MLGNDMKIVVIHNTHNANVGYFDNGKCISILHEEKFNNIKNYNGFPKEALKYLSERYDFDKVDYFAFHNEEHILRHADTKDTSALETARDSWIKIPVFQFLYRSRLNSQFRRIRLWGMFNRTTPVAKAVLEKSLSDNYGVPKEKIVYTDHHFNHCVTPLYFFNLARLKKGFLLISIDGEGGGSFTKIFAYRHKNKSLKLIADSPFDASIGLLYSEMTRFLGMKPTEHEYKVMGLAAYVSDEKYFKHIYDRLKKIIWLDKKTLTFKSKYYMYVVRLFFREHLAEERFDNMAAAVQKVTEELVIDYISAAIKKTKIHNVAFSGGVFMNVKMNKKILDMPEVHKAYFQPSCGDESLVIGTAANIFLKSKIKLKPINTMYLGHKYSNNNIKKFLKDGEYFDKYEINLSKNVEKLTAELLTNFINVARFTGAGEWGARSLCNRSILGNASDLKTFYTVNDQIKMRDFWMPFAPTIMEEWAPKYIKNWNKIKKKAFESTKYMILAFDSTDLAQKHLRAAIHQKDKTLRPHIVSKKDNPEMHKLLKYYEKLTGMGGMLNTSLNIHGYPLVGTLEQAMFTFENSGLEYMTLENYVLKKA